MKVLTNKISIVLMVIAIILFIVNPILSLPFLALFYFSDKGSKGIVYSVLIGIVFGLFAYHFIPKPGYDLIKHQNIVLTLQGMTLKNVFSISGRLDLEIIPILYSYIISFLPNINLLQFFVVSSGYGILLYMMYDYRKRTKLDSISFFIIVLFVLFGFNTLYFISGLYCYIAFIIFALVFYNEYVLKKYKSFSIIMYILLVLMHNSLALPVLILFIMKLYKDKFNLKTIIILFLIFIFSYYIVSYVNTFISSPSLRRILMMYNAYTLKNEHYKIYYSGYIFAIEITKLIVTLFFTIINGIKEKKKPINNYILSLALITVLMMFKARLAIRYVMIIQFLGIVPIMEELAKNEKRKIVYWAGLTALTVFYIIFFIRVFRYQSFGDLFESKMFNSIFGIFNR